MALRVVSHDLGDRQGVVVVRGDGMEEARGTESKQLALKTAAAHGIAKPGISGNATAYPVDADGNTSDELVMGRGQVAGFQVDWPITGAL